MKLKKLFNIFLVLILVLITGCTVPGGNDVSSDTYNFTTPETDKLKLSVSWEGKDFVKDGIGKVTLNQTVDGDTAHFRASAGSLTCRFLGVNTPESTYKVEEWGFAAAAFTKKILGDAETVVLQAEPGAERQDSNGRYLAWVWYRNSATEDFRLLNLELVEHAFSVAEASGTQFQNIFLNAELTVKANKLRVWGEIDKTYDFSKIGQSFTIKELRENFATYSVAEQNQNAGTVVRTVGIVTKEDGNSAYLQSYDEATGQYYNIYVYGGFSGTIMKHGREVYIQGKIGYYNGGLQITDFDRDNSGVLAFETEEVNYYVKELTSAEYAEASDSLQAQVVKMSNLQVVNYRNSVDAKGVTTGYTLVIVDGDGFEMELRSSSLLRISGENDDSIIRTGEYFVGRTISELSAAVGFYQYSANNGYYSASGIQLVLVSGSDIKLAAKAE